MIKSVISHRPFNVEKPFFFSYTFSLGRQALVFERAAPVVHRLDDHLAVLTAL